MARKYTAAQFIKAIPGTGGVVSALAERVGCDWHTAKRYIAEYSTIQSAWEDERNKVTDKAEHNIIKAIQAGDLSMSKWWLQVMRRDEYDPPQRQEITGADGGPIVVVNWDDTDHTD